jgi:hypothetical protein
MHEDELEYSKLYKAIVNKESYIKERPVDEWEKYHNQIWGDEWEKEKYYGTFEQAQERAHKLIVEEAAREKPKRMLRPVNDA